MPNINSATKNTIISWWLRYLEQFSEANNIMYEEDYERLTGEKLDNEQYKLGMQMAGFDYTFHSSDGTIMITSLNGLNDIGSQMETLKNHQPLFLDCFLALNFTFLLAYHTVLGEDACRKLFQDGGVDSFTLRYVNPLPPTRILSMSKSLKTGDCVYVNGPFMAEVFKSHSATNGFHALCVGPHKSKMIVRTFRSMGNRDMSIEDLKKEMKHKFQEPLSYDELYRLHYGDAVDQSFNVTAGSLVYGSNGAEFTIAKKGDSPTIQSKFYIFFGSVSIFMKAASGQGVISSIVLESDDLDEIDWEFMGGNGTDVETNYFGKGNTTSYDRATYYNMGTDPRADFHNYTLDWTADRLEWYVDSTLIRTLNYSDANGGYNYPQTPMTVRMGIWAGGDPGNAEGVVEWAGGLIDYSKGPYTMYVQSAEVQDYSTGSAYEWTDKTGSWQSIKAIAGNSTAQQTIVKASTPSLSVAQKFAALPQTTKVAIYAGGGAGAALLLSALLFTCIRQRRKGRAEREAYNASIEKEREAAFQDQMDLRERGLGGWDKDAYEKQGDDALGGWGGTHISPADMNTASKGADLQKDEFPLRANSPVRTMSPAQISRVASPTIAAPVPTRMWNGGNEQDLGAFTQNNGYAGSNNIPRSPSLGMNGGYRSPAPPQQDRGFPFPNASLNRGGYQRF
ncbi:hypothetical protein B7494_g1851 [Chlorociboria aeruginascens]|nr:hypothetical protein B7494_g1851 [Chlorociboria aeruginascens]